MKSLSYRDIAEAVGITAIVGSLLFVGFQLRQDARIARADVLGSFVATSVSRVQGDYPYADLIVKANSGDPLSKSEQYILDQMIGNSIVNIQYLNIRAQLVGGVSGGTNELYLASRLFQNPGLRVAWERVDSNIRKYTDPFRTPESLARTYKSGSGALRDRVNSNLSRMDETL